DTFNVVLGARLAPTEVLRALEEVLVHFDSVHRPFSWWVAPGDEPSDLAERLGFAGLVREEQELAMAAQLRSAPLAVTPPRGLRVERATTASRLSDFARINAENWTPPDANVERCYARSTVSVLAGDSPQRFFVALLEERPVAAVEVTTAGGVAGVYNL